MAEKNEEQDETEGEEATKKAPMSARTRLIILIAVGVLVILGSIGGTLLLLGVFDSDEDEESVAGGEEMAAMDQQPALNKPKPAMYFPIKPAFVVNFPAKGRQRYLQADITVMTRDPDIFTALQAHIPVVKNRLVMLLGGEVYEELQTDEGKELLRQKAMDALNEIMQQEVGKTGIEQVLFTNFVMQ